MNLAAAPHAGGGGGRGRFLSVGLGAQLLIETAPSGFVPGMSAGSALANNGRRVVAGFMDAPRGWPRCTAAPPAMTE